MEASETSIADPPPDWATLQREILCPLCDYNLRGLSDPRCPECGYQFTWAGLQDDLRNQQEWFFEHQKRRPIRSLLKTWFVSLRPRRFWTLVQPTNPPNIRKLLLYWFLVALFLASQCIVSGIPHFIRRYGELAQMRQRFLADLKTYSQEPWSVQNIAKYGSPQAAVDAEMPRVWPWQLTGKYGFNRSPADRLAMHLYIILICWPWLTLLEMIIFRHSLRQGKIKAVHLLRCTVYAADAAPLLLAPATYLLARQIGTNFGYYFDAPIVFDPIALVTLGAIYGILCYRLTIAYSYYLSFPHALATCIATQLIAILVMFLMMPWTF